MIRLRHLANQRTLVEHEDQRWTYGWDGENRLASMEAKAHSPMGHGLMGTYYSTVDLTGAPALSRMEAVDFDWGSASPAPGTIPVDNFSIRWTGYIQAPTTGTYYFSTDSDDGVRLWIGDSLVINNWTGHGATTDTSAGIQLTAGQLYPVKLEFFDSGYAAVIRLKWRKPGDASASIIPSASLFTTIEETLPMPVALRQKLEFGYDGMGRRIAKKVSTWDTATGGYVVTSDIRFLYDGWNLLAELDTGGSPVRSYAWGLDLSGSSQGAGGVGGLLFSAAGAATYAALHDGNGNVIGQVDMASGALAATYDYNAFGEIVAEAGPATGLPFGFSTKYTDRETGLAYYGLRYYNPSTGRWLSRDPIGENGGFNLYGMVANNPINLWDYLGLDLCSDLRARLAVAQDIQNKVKAQFAAGGEYTEVISYLDSASLAALSGAVTSAGRAEYIAAQVAANGTSHAYGTTYYSSAKPSSAQNAGVVGNYVSLVGAGLDGYSLGTAIVNDDAEGIGFSGANIVADLTAAAAGGPVGLAIAGGQLGINGALVGYSAYENHKYKQGLIENAKRAAYLADLARKTIQNLNAQINVSCPQACMVKYPAR